LKKFRKAFDEWSKTKKNLNERRVFSWAIDAYGSNWEHMSVIAVAFYAGWIAGRRSKK